MIHLAQRPLIAGLLFALFTTMPAQKPAEPPVCKVKPGSWVEYRTITNTLKPDAPTSRRLSLKAHWEVQNGQKVEKGEVLGRTPADDPVPAPFDGVVYTRLPAGRKGVLLMSKARFRLDLPQGLVPLKGTFKWQDADNPVLPFRIAHSRKGDHYTVHLEGNDPRLAPFRPLTLQVPVTRHRHSLVIETAWIQWDRHQPFLWLERDGVVHRQDIRYGTPVGDRCPVLEGLNPGDKVLLPSPGGQMPEWEEGQVLASGDNKPPKSDSDRPEKARRKQKPATHSSGKSTGGSPLRLLKAIRPVLSVHLDKQDATPLANAISPWSTLLNTYAQHYGIPTPSAHTPPAGANAPAFQIAGRLPLPGSGRMEAWFGVDLRSFSSTDNTSIQLAWPQNGPVETHQFNNHLKMRYTHLFLGLSCNLHRWLWAQALVGMDLGHLDWEFTRQASEDGASYLNSRTSWSLSGSAPALTLGLHGRFPIHLGHTRLLTFLRVEYRWTGERSWSGQGTSDGGTLSGTWCADSSNPDGAGILLPNVGTPLKTSAHAFRLGLGIVL